MAGWLLVYIILIYVPGQFFLYICLHRAIDAHFPIWPAKNVWSRYLMNRCLDRIHLVEWFSRYL